ncbi:MAG: hypothetical protein ACRDON_11870 [Gaiellaceae bacterium]
MGRGDGFALRLAALIAMLGALALLGGSALAGMDHAPVAAAHDGNAGDKGDRNRCMGGTASTTMEDGTLVQTCTITARRGSCIQRSDNPVVKQVCTFVQAPPASGAAKENRATAVQVVQADGREGTLDATQEVVVLQRNTTKGNVFAGTQTITHCLAAGGSESSSHKGDCGNGNGNNGDQPSSATVTQSEESQQSIDVCQGGPATTASTGPGSCNLPGGMVANNTSRVRQTTDLTEIAADADEIDQLQNREDRANQCTIETPGVDEELSDTCYTVRQNTAGAHATNLTELQQDLDVTQRANDTTTGEQLQGRRGRGGLEHVFVQNSPDPASSKQASDQNKRWTQIRLNTGDLVWEQHDKNAKGTGIQLGSSANRAFIDQESILDSIGPGDGQQTAVLVILCDSSGNCTGSQRAVVNGVEETNFESAPFIDLALVCGDVEPFPDDDDFQAANGDENGGTCAPEESEPPEPPSDDP